MQQLNRKIFIQYILVLTVVTAILLSGCGAAQRQKSRTHTKREIIERGVRVVKVPRDSIVYEPRIIKKDTTIIVENRHIVLKTTYRNQRPARIVAQTKPVSEVTTYERTEQVNAHTQNSQTDRMAWHPDNGFMITVFLGLALLITVSKILDKVL